VDYVQVLSLNLEAAALSYSSRLDLNEASFNVVNAMVAFLYTGEVDHHFMAQRGLDLLHAAHRVRIFPFSSDVPQGSSVLLSVIIKSQILTLLTFWVVLLSHSWH
jgi:hypothetical protein